MPVIRLTDVPEIAAVGPDSAPLVMRKAIGSRKRDPSFAMPTSTESLSITHIRHWGRHRKITCKESDRVMFVVEGDAITKVGKEPATHIGPGDFVLIPKGTPYEFSGNFTYLVVNAPAFKDGSDLRDDAYDGPPLRVARRAPTAARRPRRA
jgi:mannose-6-phosphate isomerase-like protein (cupin superfamily)